MYTINWQSFDRIKAIIATTMKKTAPRQRGRAGRPPRPPHSQLAERVEGRHLDVIGTGGVVGLIAAMADIGAGCGKEVFRVFDPLYRIEDRLHRLVVVVGSPSICSALKTL